MCLWYLVYTVFIYTTYVYCFLHAPPQYLALLFSTMVFRKQPQTGSQPQMRKIRKSLLLVALATNVINFRFSIFIYFTLMYFLLITHLWRQYGAGILIDCPIISVYLNPGGIYTNIFHHLQNWLTHRNEIKLRSKKSALPMNS